jgi:hypothetical protein
MKPEEYSNSRESNDLAVSCGCGVRNHFAEPRKSEKYDE